MKVVLGVDDSSFSTHAVEHVKRFPWPPATEFHVVSAAMPVFMGPGEAAAPAAIEALIQSQEKHHQGLAAKAAESLRAGGLRATSASVVADPRSALLDAVKRHGAELLVVGSHGRTGLTKFLLGSVAAHVVSHAPCSVLVVKQPA
jgi:nucleotide-binding universal stress UspA family protein